MKTTRIIGLFAAAMSIMLTATASAAPRSKHVGATISHKSATSVSSIEHKTMHRVGPPGKGYVCNR